MSDQCPVHLPRVDHPVSVAGKGEEVEEVMGQRRANAQGGPDILR